MTDVMMDIDPPAVATAPTAAAPPASNAMSALMAGAREKGKGKANEGGMSEADLKAIQEKEGLPWYVFYSKLSAVLFAFQALPKTKADA
jgi:hypothetical protein